MNMRLTLTTLALAAAMALMTVLLGWWTVPVLGLLFGVFAPARGAASGMAALAGAAAWAFLLMSAAARGDVAAVATQMGNIMLVPWYAVVTATLLFPALLGWSSARLGEAVGAMLGVRRHEEPTETALGAAA
jgi:hypothetical protein